ncbi:MAG: hypothetical protein PHS92_03125 [Candidatus Gracilibacteria bacterium]|nr:hypothetical protein [Candidatus Gracilibacteria bacterium]
MSDIFNEYKKQKSRRNIVIISLSLVFALSINAFLFDTNVGKKIQTSVRNYDDTSKEEVKKDLYFESTGSGTDILELKAGTSFSKADSLNLSILLNPEVLKLADFTSDDKDVQITKIANDPGVFNFTIKFKDPQDIKSGDVLAKLLLNRLKQENTSINLAQTMFISEGKTYELTNESMDY